jgi:hypothetical protein
MAGYFNFFPSTEYANTIVTNLISKVKFDQSVQKNLAVFYPYTVEQGERPDQIAARYYNNPELDWVIYLANDIMDPYYDWPLSQNQFYSYIAAKYGSVSEAQSKIAFYRNNYASDDTVLSISSYNALSQYVKKYFKPVLGFNGQVVSYERKELDQVLETNQVIDLTISFGTFNVGDRFTQGDSSGYVTFANTSHVILDKITGSFTIGSATNATITAANTVSQPIPEVEVSYWEPVTCLTYEEEINESKHYIKILDKAYVGKIEKDMRELFR